MSAPKRGKLSVTMSMTNNSIARNCTVVSFFCGPKLELLPKRNSAEGFDLDQNNEPCEEFSSAHPGERRKDLENVMTALKSLTIIAVLLVGGTSLAMAQNGLPTGGQSPVAGGANGGGWGYAGGVYGYPGYGYGYYPGYGYINGFYRGYGYGYPAYGYSYPAYGYR